MLSAPDSSKRIIPPRPFCLSSRRDNHQLSHNCQFCAIHQFLCGEHSLAHTQTTTLAKIPCQYRNFSSPLSLTELLYRCKFIMMRGSSRGEGCPNSRKLTCIFIIFGILAFGVSTGVGRFLTPSDDEQDYGYVLSPMVSESPDKPWRADNPENGYMAAFTGMQWFLNLHIHEVFIGVSHSEIIPKIAPQQPYQLLALPPPVA